MSGPTQDDSNLAIVRDVMREAVGVMEAYPAGYTPPDLDLPTGESGRDGGGDELIQNPDVVAWLRGVMDSWPERLMPLFVDASSIIAQVLDMSGGRHDGGVMDMLSTCTTDWTSRQLLAAWAHSGETGMPPVFQQELRRRGLAHRLPFARTLTTLLGRDALVWLTTAGRHGTGKIQPHEFSRTGWPDLWTIETQLAIEEELLRIEPEAGDLGKAVVALSWTLAGLASFLPPAIFFGERESFISATREGGLTVSSGGLTLVSFEPAAIRPLVRILADGLMNPLLSASDLMWIGAGLARLRDVRAGTDTKAVPTRDERYAVFLSHRGRDAKRSLARLVRSLHPDHGIFLDCLALPRGVVNRSFVYGSLARSERVLIVETERFYESPWCRKEAWLADAMAAQGLGNIVRVTLPEAEAYVAAEGPSTKRLRPQQGLGYGPFKGRVLQDIEDATLGPNLYTLTEAGHPTDSLVPLQTALAQPPRPDDPAWVEATGEAVAETLAGVVATAPDAEPFALWATALQYSLAAFGSTSNARSKVEVRWMVGQLSVLLKSLVDAGLHRDPVFRAAAPGYLAVVAGASAIELAGFELDPRMTPALRAAIGGNAGVRDGLLLLDVRRPGPLRDFRLRLLAALVRGDLGSVGIVQDATDEVHQTRVDGLALEVLPCVTLYPGMDSPFETTA